MNKKFKVSVKKAGKAVWNSLPILMGIILLIGLANAFIPKSVYISFFSGFPLSDAVIGAVIGSILAGSPITSYIVSGELLAQGIDLVAVTAFIVAWVTVGFITFPAESMLLGKKFAFIRNATSFVFSILVALITVSIWLLL